MCECWGLNKRETKRKKQFRQQKNARVVSKLENKIKKAKNLVFVLKYKKTI